MNTSIRKTAMVVGLPLGWATSRFLTKTKMCQDPEERGGSPDPPPHPRPEKLQALLVRIHWKITKLPPSIQCWAVIGPLAKRQLENLKKKKKRYQNWTPSGKTFWICHSMLYHLLPLNTCDNADPNKTGRSKIIISILRDQYLKRIYT